MFRKSDVVLTVLSVATSALAADKVTYDDHLLPILRNECTSCHNPDKKKAGLDLSTYQSALGGGDSGAIATAGDPDSSLLYKVVAHLEDPKMPKGKGKLPDKDVNLFKQWIAGGLLENAGGKAVVSGKPKVSLTVTSAGSARPTGPIAMPTGLSVDAVVHTKRPGALMCLAASPWAPLVAVGGRHQVVLYNTSTLDLLGILPFPEGDPYATAFSRNGGTLVVGGGVSAKSGRVVLFDVATGRRITQVGDEFDAVLAADISPDQSTVALGGPGKTVKVYSTSDGQLLHAIKKHTDWVTAVAYSPDGVLLASGDRAGGLWVWESRSANEFYSLTGHKSAITAVAFRDDSNILASASEDGTVKLWDMPTGKLVKTFNAHAPGVTSVAYTHDGRIVTCGRDKLVRLWNPEGTALAASSAFPDIALHATFDGEGARVVAGDWSGAVRVFDAKTAKPLGDITANPPSLGERLAAADQDLKATQAAYDKDAAAFDLATRRLAEAKSRFTSLKSAQARSGLASKQLELEKISAAAHAARLAADRASARLRDAQQLIDDGPALIKIGEQTVAKANEATSRTRSQLGSAAHGLNQLTGLAKSVGQVAQQLSDAARASADDKDLSLVAAKAKASFDGINSALESADRLVAIRTRDAQTATAQLAHAAAALEQRKASIAAAPKSIDALRRDLDSATTEARKQADAQQRAAKEVDLARLRLQSLAATQPADSAHPSTSQPVAQKN